MIIKSWYRVNPGLVYSPVQTVQLYTLAVTSTSQPHWLHTYWVRESCPACQELWHNHLEIRSCFNIYSEICFRNNFLQCEVKWMHFLCLFSKFSPLLYILWARQEDAFSNHWPSEEHMSCSSDLIPSGMDSGQCAWTSPDIAIMRKEKIHVFWFSEICYVQFRLLSNINDHWSEMSVLGNGKLRSSFRKLRYGSENGVPAQEHDQKMHQVKLYSGKLSSQSHISVVF